MDMMEGGWYGADAELTNNSKFPIRVIGEGTRMRACGVVGGALPTSCTFQIRFCLHSSHALADITFSCIQNNLRLQKYYK